MHRWPETLGSLRVRLLCPDTLFAYTFILLSRASDWLQLSVQVPQEIEPVRC